MERGARTLLAAVIVVVFATTSLDGSTHYLSSQALRAAALAWIVLTPRTRAPHILLATVLSILLALLAFGLTASERLASGFDFWATVACAVAVLIVGSETEDAWRRSTLDGLAWVGGAHALWALGELAVSGTRASAGFFNPNYLGAWLVLLSVHAWQRGGRARHLLLPLLIGGVLATGSRSALLALALGAAVLLSTRPWGRWVGGAGVAATGLMLVLAGRWVGGQDAYAFDRVQIWRTALRAGWLEPLGWGLGDASHAFRTLGVPLQHGVVRYPKVAYHAHSELLHLWVELGVVTLIVLGLVLVALGSLRRRHATLMLLVAAAPPVLLGGPLHVPVYSLTLALLLSSEVEEEQRGVTAWSRVAVAAAALGVAFALPGSASRLLQDRAVMLRDGGQLDAALQRSQWAMQVAPFDPSAHLLRASLLFARDQDTEVALETLYDLTERFSSDPRPPERAARLLSALPADEPRDRALADTLRARLAREPKAAPVWVSYAQALQRLGRHDESVAALVRAVEVEPNCAQALAELAMMRKDPEGAAALAARALRSHDEARRHRDYPRSVLTLPPVLESRARALVPESVDIASIDLRIDGL